MLATLGIGDLERVGYATSAGRGRARVARRSARRATSARGGPRRPADRRRIEVDANRDTIRLPPGVRLDLGGSAKGLAVDLAADVLADSAAYAVDAGGDIRIGGADTTPRTIDIAHPLHDEIAHRFTLSAGAVATSGLGTRIWRDEQGFSHHLIDPSRGMPAWTGAIQATALAPTALEAEVLAKTALRGPEAGREVLSRDGGALILDDGRLVLAGRVEAAATQLPEIAA